MAFKGMEDWADALDKYKQAAEHIEAAVSRDHVRVAPARVQDRQLRPLLRCDAEGERA